MPVLRRPSSRKVWTFVAAMLLLGIAAGAVWQWLAEPAEWMVQPDGNIVLTELAARDQFGVTVLFVVVGAVVSLVWGVASGHALRDLGWLLTPLVVATTLVAAVVAWQVGMELGPVGPREAVDPGVGDRLPSKLEIDSFAAFIVWPIFGVAGLLLSTWLGKDTHDHVEAHTPTA